MKKNRLLSRLGEAVFGKAKPDALITAEPPPKLDKEKFLRHLMRRRAPKRRHQFVRKSMTRGVQIALERAQRPSRLAFIYNSMRQDVELAAQRRHDYLQRRTKRWRVVVEDNLPRIFNEELQRQGIVSR